MEKRVASEAKGGLDPFAFACDTPPLVPPIPLSVAPGDRFHLFLYILRGSTEVRTLVVPAGR